MLAVEKRVTSTLMESSTTEKIVEIDKHIGCACSGLMADSRTMVDRARVEAQNHWFMYNEKMSVESVTQSVSNLAIQFGDSDSDGQAMSRPFGVAILFAGVDDQGTQLFHMDPSGTYVQCDAKAIGSGCEGAQQALQEAYHKVSNCLGVVQLFECSFECVAEHDAAGSHQERAHDSQASDGGEAELDERRGGYDHSRPRLPHVHEGRSRGGH